MLSIYDIIKGTWSAYHRLPVVIDVTVKVPGPTQTDPAPIYTNNELMLGGFDDAESIYDIIKGTGSVAYHRLPCAIDVTVNVTTW